jgi:alkanesulfonate monooxygenase SsuD/methylene tetrahydromethanopterin reductase-like flavin-dependent oxidoreductase (luciferase family)
MKRDQGSDTIDTPPLGVYLPGMPTFQEEVGLAKLAEQLGFNEVWRGIGLFGRDPLLVLAAIARETSQITLGTAIFPIWTRNVADLAGTLATINEIAGPNRVICGLGSWWEPATTYHGINRSKSLTAMRETVTSLSNLFKGEKFSFQGEFVRLENAKLNFKNLQETKIPVCVGAIGDRMLKLAASLADGIIINYLLTPDYVKRATQLIETERVNGRKDVDEFLLPQLIHTFLDEDADLALNEARLIIAKHLFRKNPGHPTVLGVPDDLILALKKNGIEKGKDFVTDDIVRLFVAAGTTDDCLNKFHDLIQNGCTLPLVFPRGPDPRRTMRALRDEK